MALDLRNFVVLVIFGFLWAGRSDRQAYRAARGAIDQRVEDSQVRINTAVQMATDAVDTALTLAGNLPSQQAKADLVKQDIQEIGSRLREVSEATGDAAVEKLDALDRAVQHDAGDGGGCLEGSGE